MNSADSKPSTRSPRQLVLLLGLAGFVFLSSFSDILPRKIRSVSDLSLAAIPVSLLAVSLLGIWNALRGKMGRLPFAKTAFLACIGYGVFLCVAGMILGLWLGIPAVVIGISGLDELKARDRGDEQKPAFRRGNYYASIGATILFGMTVLMFLAMIVGHFTEPAGPGRGGLLSLGVLIWGTIVSALFVVCLRWYRSERRKALREPDDCE